MSSFEFFAAYYGLLLGLGLAELLNRLSGLLSERERPRIGVMTPLISMLVLTEMLANFIDAWNRMQGIRIELATLFIPTVIAMIYYVVAVIVVPRDTSDWRSLDDYFDARRRWIVGLLLAVNLIITVSTNPAATTAALLAGRLSGDVLIQIFATVWLVGGYLCLLMARRRWQQAACALGLIIFYPVFYVLIRQETFKPLLGL